MTDEASSGEELYGSVTLVFRDGVPHGIEMGSGDRRMARSDGDVVEEEVAIVPLPEPVSGQQDFMEIPDDEYPDPIKWFWGISEGSPEE